MVCGSLPETLSTSGPCSAIKFFVCISVVVATGMQQVFNALCDIRAEKDNVATNRGVTRNRQWGVVLGAGGFAPCREGNWRSKRSKILLIFWQK